MILACQKPKTPFQKSLEEVTSAFEELADTLSETNEEDTASQQILEQIIDFFTEDDWSFTKIKGEPVLRIVFQGENGEWICCAIAIEEQRQFVFYSVCPVNAPKNRWLAMAEFLTKANSGRIIGNFEMNTDGEICYKTSIDVKGDRLSFELIKQLVSANIKMMDEYLPEIMSVIYGDVEPKDAVAQIEITQPSDEKQQDDREDTLNPSSQKDVRQPQEQLFEKSHVLSWLTREEIAKFQQAMQMQQPYQRQQAQAIIEKLKSKIANRESNLGEEMFARAYALFININFSSKIIKLIQRYSGLAGQTRSLLQRLSQGSDRNREVQVNSRSQTDGIELEKLFWSIDSRLQELATGELEDKQEVALLIEIEQIREQLLLYEQRLK